MITAEARGWLICVAVMALSGCGLTKVRESARPPLGCSTANDTLIVPGCRVGPYTIGMTEADLLTHFGRPSKAWPNQGGGDTSDYEFEGGSIYLRVVGQSVVWVKAYSPRYATASGLRAGASVLEMKAALGKPRWVNQHEYRDGTGLFYCFVDPSGGVVGVDVKNDSVFAIGAGGCRP